MLYYVIPAFIAAGVILFVYIKERIAECKKKQFKRKWYDKN